jgi:hypothetical protein
MVDLRGRTCGAELLPATSFCRQCGSATARPGGSEEATAFLTPPGNVATQRLDPRATNPEQGGLNLPAAAAPFTPERTLVQKGKSSRKLLIVGLVLLVLIIGLICAVAIVRIRSHSRTMTSVNLVYPGAQTLVDMNYEDGSRAVQLVTPDSLEKVESWYTSLLRPTKTIRLTSTSVVMKNLNTTVTIAVEDNKTNVLIKKTP